MAIEKLHLGALPQDFPPYGVILNEYDEDSLRRYCLTLLEEYVPSKVGDPRFVEICQGRAELAKKTESFFSTCGELVMFMLARAGYRGLLLNRDIELPTGVKRKYIYGRNMTYIRYRSVDERAWVDFKPGRTPRPGDVFFVSNGPPATEHVGIFKEIRGNKIITFDGGQGTKYEQEAKICERELVGTKLGSRTLHGWIDISKLNFTEAADLEYPRQEEVPR